MRRTPIFHSADLANLKSQNLVSPATRPGWLKVSPTILLDGPYLNYISPTSTFTIPEYLETVETLRSLGFTHEKATSVCTLWQIDPKANAQNAASNSSIYDAFFNFVLGSIPEADDIAQATNKECWEEMIISWGFEPALAKPLKETALDEVGDTIVRGKTLRKWVVGMLDLRWGKLMKLRRESEARVKECVGLQR